MGTQEGEGVRDGRAPAGIVEFYYYYPKRSISIGKLSLNVLSKASSILCHQYHPK